MIAAHDTESPVVRKRPADPAPAFGHPGDVDACLALLAKGSKSFAAASRVLPRRVRDAAAVLYAFCRVADDAVDEGVEEDRVDRLRSRLAHVYAGRDLQGPVERAFADVVRLHALPIEIFEAMLEGFAWDAGGRSYETLSDVLAYSARVASTVGAAMTAIMGKREPHMVARACDLGLAMQLTNIARDVGEDAAMGRLYLPAEWLREEGVDPAAFLREPKPHPGVLRVVLRLLDEADALYERAGAGIAALPADVRPAIYAARFVYADIGRVIRTKGGDSVTSRAVVNHSRKAALVWRALVTTWSAPGPALFEPPAREVEMLVRAVSQVR